MTGLMPATELVLLGLLTAGQTATVETVLGGSEEVHRLREIGLTDGARVQMLQPGRLCLLKLGDQRLGVRSEALSTVLVRTEARA